MKHDDISKMNLPGRPAITSDGAVLVAISRPDQGADRYAATLRLLASGPGRDNSVAPFSAGPRDSAPVLSPNGHTVVFLRAAETGPPQLHKIELHGGEARKLTAHPLGAGECVFSDDGNRIAYLAPVPVPGRYGTDENVTADEEPPRPIGRMSYRRDGRGFTLDRPDQVFLLDLRDGAEPVRVTDEPDIDGGPVFLPDGRLGYLRATAPDELRSEFAAVAAPGDGSPSVGDLVVRLPGSATQPVVHGDALFYLGVEFDGIDAPGRTTGLWTVPALGGLPRRLTGVDVEVDTGSAPFVLGGAVLVTVLDRGSVSLRAVAIGADNAPLDALGVVIGGRRVVTSFGAVPLKDGGARVAAIVASPLSPGEVSTLTVDADGRVVEPEQVRTDLAADLRATGLADHLEITASAPDGFPVHGFLLLPRGSGPHPVLLVVHGGPHAAYGWGLFDEAQIYADAGYAVVLPNPRGSAGYGHEHGRAVLGRLGTVDADDVLALLDAALERPDCDSTRVGVMGGSYGGFMTSWLASKAPDRFTAAISERAVNAWDSFAGSSDIGYFFAEVYAGAGRDSQWAASPLAYADQIELPLLIIHSENDWRCPLEQGQRLFVALKSRGHEVEMLLFPGEGHELSRSGRPRHRLHRFEAILSWWQRYLPISV